MEVLTVLKRRFHSSVNNPGRNLPVKEYCYLRTLLTASHRVMLGGDGGKGGCAFWWHLDPPIVNINKNRSEKNTELILRFINGGFPRYVVNQLNILVPVGKDIKIVTPVK